MKNTSLKFKKIPNFSQGVCQSGIADLCEPKKKVLAKSLSSKKAFTTGWWISNEKPVMACVTSNFGDVTVEVVYRMGNPFDLIDAAIKEVFGGYSPIEALDRRYPGITEEQVSILRRAIANAFDHILSFESEGMSIRKSEKCQPNINKVLPALNVMEKESESQAALIYQSLVDCIRYQMDRFVQDYLVGNLIFTV